MPTATQPELRLLVSDSVGECDLCKDKDVALYGPFNLPHDVIWLCAPCVVKVSDKMRELHERKSS